MLHSPFNQLLNGLGSLGKAPDHPDGVDTPGGFSAGELGGFGDSVLKQVAGRPSKFIETSCQ